MNFCRKTLFKAERNNTKRKQPDFASFFCMDTGDVFICVRIVYDMLALSRLEVSIFIEMTCL